ncbi:NADH:ubiquinone oxidoreductase intermediate-associated protein 30 [Xylaria sp. FL1777]|nr:NADH:ubiquinone oxidoreductase intermediate-associated protein 30 [Xylaria sp. FL1777]
MATLSEEPKYLFGGEARHWQAESWVPSDDRVRGGKSTSHLEHVSRSRPEDTVRFHGELDITALGGAAGFASRRSPERCRCRWGDLSRFDGLRLAIVGGDGKRYTLVLKDTVLPRRPDGREQSTVSWEYDFAGLEGEVCVPWGNFRPTYRGRSKPDAEPLDLTSVKSISIMIRSFFGEQEGPFALGLQHIAADVFRG